MHRNYYLFKRQVEFLNHKLSSSKINRCFTHRKDELVLELSSNGSYFLRIGVQIQLPYLIFYPTQNIKDPSIDFFSEIIGRSVIKFHIEPFDKIVYVYCEKFCLQMIFFGKNPNVYLLDENKTVLSAFKNIKTAKDVRKHDMIFDPLSANMETLIKILQSGKEWPCSDFLNHYFGGFNQLMSREVCYRCNIEPVQKINSFSKVQLEMLVHAIKNIAEEVSSSETRLYFQGQYPRNITLFELTHVNSEVKPQLYSDVNKAWKQFLKYYQIKRKLDSLLNLVKNGLMKRINHLQNTLKKIAEAEKLESKKEEAELKGNLLLTYAADLKKGPKEVQVKNIFSDKQELIKIKLNPSKSIHENAQKYFMKYKDIFDQKLKIAVRKDSYQSELQYWEELYSKSQNITTFKQAEKLYHLLVERKILQSTGAAYSRQEPDLQGAFHRLLLGKKWEVFIGRNASNNDVLTFKFAHKFDLWLHAQGVTGSHVIIRLAAKEQLPPMDIIEQAASAAAYFSSAKHSSTVPVNYTRVRHVRKPRKSSPGTVVISNEKTIFVTPKKFI
jgi:predicted ribosome quality control (RQC) complex YloA/Tae2 family protein